MALFKKRSPTEPNVEPMAAPASASALPPAPAPSPEPPHHLMVLRRQPGWRSRDILRAAALVFGFYLALQLLWLAHPLFLAAFLGLNFGLSVARGADYLQRLHIPRGVGAALLVFGTYAVIYGIFAVSAPKLSEQFGELRTRLPEATDKVERWLAEHQNGVVGQVLNGAREAAPAPGPTAPAGAPVPATPSTAPAPAGKAGARGTARTSGVATPPQTEGGSQIRNALTRQLGTLGHYLFPFLSSTLEVLGGLLLITFMAIYIGAEPEVYHGGLMALFPHQARPVAEKVLAARAISLRKWLLTQFIAMLSIGVIWWIALAIIGVKAALSLAVIAGLLEFIPTIGPILSAVPAVAMGFLDSPQKALLVVFVYTAIQMIEGHLLIPILMKEGMDLPPVLTLLGQALLALVFGFLGLVVAVPLIAVIVVTVKMLYVEGVVGDGEDEVVASG